MEQDLILCRALVEIFRERSLARTVALRGGTALHKLYVKKPLRYSEDIDLVQLSSGPAGPLLDAVRTRLDPFLGTPQRDRSADSVRLVYRMESEVPPVTPMKLKIEVNTREHFSVYGVAEHPLRIGSPWFQGEAVIRTYTIEELLATKLRALFQRRKGRDLFDLWVGLKIKGTDPKKIVHAFRRYLTFQGRSISRTTMEKNLALKVGSPQFNRDIFPLLASGTLYQADQAGQMVTEKLVSLM